MHKKSHEIRKLKENSIVVTIVKHQVSAKVSISECLSTFTVFFEIRRLHKFRKVKNHVTLTGKDFMEIRIRLQNGAVVYREKNWPNTRNEIRDYHHYLKKKCILQWFCCRTMQIRMNRQSKSQDHFHQFPRLNIGNHMTLAQQSLYQRFSPTILWVTVSEHSLHHQLLSIW